MRSSFDSKELGKFNGISEYEANFTEDSEKSVDLRGNTLVEIFVNILLVGTGIPLYISVTRI